MSTRETIIWTLRLLILIMAVTGVITYPVWALLGFVALALLVRLVARAVEITTAVFAAFGPRP